MADWKEKIRQGNEHFDRQHWQLAESVYLDAVADIEEEWFASLENVPLMMAWIANMHNLATLYEMTQQRQMAGTYYVLPYRRVLTLMKAGGMSSEFQFALMYAMRNAALPLLEFSKRYPVCECCQQHLDRISDWLKTPSLDILLPGDTGREPVSTFHHHEQGQKEMTLH